MSAAVRSLLFWRKFSLGARQHQPPAFAARQHADGGARLRRYEQEILHIADHMARLAVDRDEIAAAAGQRILQGGVSVELFALLIEARDAEILAEADGA